MLSDAARFALGYVCVTDSVEDRCLTVVNVTHNNYDRRSADEVSVVILAVVDNLFLDCNDYLFLNLCVELHSDELRCIVVDCIVRGNHRAHHKRLFNNLGYCSLEA